jgi:hypothetical protein
MWTLAIGMRRLRAGVSVGFLGLGAMLAACSDTTSPESAARVADITVEASQLRRYVEALADDSMCGRGAGSVYEREAAEYVRNAFGASGLEPGITEYFQPFPVAPINVDDPGTPPGACDGTSSNPSQNVLGVLPGAGALAGEWVLVGAHYDHLGWVGAGGDVTVYNGADDNASGTALLLEVARLLARWVAAHPAAAPARRSMLFQAFGAEEEGLLGSERFVADPTVPLDSVVAMINFDMVGRLRNNTLTVSGVGSAPSWRELLAAANVARLDFAFDDQVLGRSDHYPFYLLGIPVVHFFTGFHEDYHRPTDDVVLLNVEGMASVGRLAISLVWDLATRPPPPVAQGRLPS